MDDKQPKDTQHQSMANLTWSNSSVTPAMRALSLKQKPRCIWFTGLSGAGKSTLANALEIKLHHEGLHTMLLDGDNVRHGLCRDLGMVAADRSENIRRVSETAKILVDAGVIVIAAFISPFREDRARARALFGTGEFSEVYLMTSLQVCESRDPKGLYRKARTGEIADFTGISSPYEAPDMPELVLDTENKNIEALVEQILVELFPERWPR